MRRSRKSCVIGEALLCNQASLELLEVTEDQLASRAAASHGNQPQSFVVSQQISETIANRKPVRDAMLAVKRPAHGDNVWLLASSEPQLAADGSVSTVISTFLDITQHKLAEDSERAARPVA